MPKRRTKGRMRCILERLSSETRISGGSSETETNAFAVMPCVCSWYSAVRTVTPEAKCPNAFRNCRVSIFSDPSLAAILHYNTNVVWINEIGHRPAIQVVLSHALLGESFILRRLPQLIGHHQGFKSNALVIAEVVALVEFVPPAELGAHGVPHQLHELHAIERGVAVGAAHESFEIIANLGHLEIVGVRGQIDQRARQYVFDDLLKAWINQVGRYAIGQAVIEIGQHIARRPGRGGARHG